MKTPQYHREATDAERAAWLANEDFLALCKGVGYEAPKKIRKRSLAEIGDAFKAADTLEGRKAAFYRVRKPGEYSLALPDTKEPGQLSRPGSLFLHQGHGTADNDGLHYVLASSVRDGSPMILCEETRRWYFLTWPDLLALAIAKGIAAPVAAEAEGGGL